jgi:hypothetical protein
MVDPIKAKVALAKGGRPKKPVSKSSLTPSIHIKCVDKEKTGLRGCPCKSLTTKKCDQLTKRTVNPIVMAVMKKETIFPADVTVIDAKRTRSQTKVAGKSISYIFCSGVFF